VLRFVDEGIMSRLFVCSLLVTTGCLSGVKP